MSRLLVKKGFLACLLVLIVLIGIGVGRVVIQSRTLRQEVSSLEAEAEKLSSKNTQLLEFLARFETDAFLEREARMKLHLQRPGEEVIALREREGEFATSTDPEPRRFGARDNIERWRRYFFPE